MNSKEIKESIPLKKVIEDLGIQFEKESGNQFWYKSPFAEKVQKTGSLTIDTKFHIQTWYDFSLGRGGQIIDFVMEYYKMSFQEALNFLNEHYSPAYSQNKKLKTQREFGFEKEESLLSKPPKNHSEVKTFTQEILEKEIYDWRLKKYISDRKIKLETAKRFLKEIQFKTKSGKEIFAVGFKNNSNGWEWRNKGMGGCLLNKDIRTLEFGEKTKRSKISVFEGFFDFLGYLDTFFTSKSLYDENLAILVLNSVAMSEQGKEYIQKNNFETVELYLDNDEAGESATNEFLKLKKQKVVDKRSLYEGFKDLNDFVIKRTPNFSEF